MARARPLKQIILGRANGLSNGADEPSTGTTGPSLQLILDPRGYLLFEDQFR